VRRGRRGKLPIESEESEVGLMERRRRGLINGGSGEVPINWTPVSPRNIEW
jgi:hypothetical protein